MTDTANIAACLELARKLLNKDRTHFVEFRTILGGVLSSGDRAIADSYTAASAACAHAAGELQRLQAEHAQRVTLQHHAADLAQRVADLEAERDALAAKLAAIERQEPLTRGQIQSIWNSASGAAPGWSRHITYARAIERAHGIGAEGGAA